MGFDKDFKPVLRFMVASDIHYKDEHSVERERMEKAIQSAYKLSEKEDYSALDAIIIVGDFANSGSEIQMKAFKKTLEDNLKPGTQAVLSMASHEFMCDGEENAIKRFKDIFAMETDNHVAINGFHFISITSTKGCHFDDDKVAYAAAELKKAAADDPKKPIFFFQHPHITDTVSGSIYWGEDELIPAMLDYPQIIDFSGHSHVPINDPRSIHQRAFTCLGTGTMSYFELDEFDKYYGTFPPEKHKAAQFLFVEANAEGAVRIYPYDVISDSFFPFVWKIDTPWDPTSFLYTDARYKNADAPWFEDGAKAVISDIKADGFTLTFDQAKVKAEYVNDYNVYLKDSRGVIVKNMSLWSDYYFADMPETLTVKFENLASGEKYHAEIYANSFWATRCEKPLISKTIEL